MNDEIRYARSGDVHIAYRTLGSGPDHVVIPGWASHLETLWGMPHLADVVEWQASFTRSIYFDKRGVGLSDPVPLSDVPSLEQWMDDLRAVLDDIGSDRVSLFAQGQGAQVAIMFAATYPERVRSLILVNAYARLAADDDYPFGMSERAHEAVVEGIRRTWGTGAAVARLAPSGADDPQLREWAARFERVCASPGTAVAMQRAIYASDVRPLLATIHVPTTVIHCRGDRFVPIEHGRFLAEHIAGARFVEVSSDDHWWWVSAAHDVMAHTKEALLADEVAGAEPDADERVLATILFEDIVGSTERVVELGDAAWRRLLDRHDAAVRAEVERYRGRIAKLTGDGVVALFDGPARAIRAALAIRDRARAAGLEVRCGIHAGEVEMRGDDPLGIAVHIASRVSGNAGAGEVLVSRTVCDLVAGSGIAFADRGAHALKGVPGDWALFAVDA